MRRLVALGLLLVVWTTAVTAAPIPITENDQRDVMVTVYNGNLGLVKDTRDARLDAGTLEVKFMDVAAQIDPTSVHLKSLTDASGLKILEQNYEYDLLTSEKLMEKYVGKKVGSTRAAVHSRRPRCSPPTAPSGRSTVRSTWGATATPSCPPCPRTWCPSRRWSGFSETPGPRPSASRPRIS